MRRIIRNLRNEIEGKSGVKNDLVHARLAWRDIASGLLRSIGHVRKVDGRERERDGEELGDKGLRVVMPGDKHGGRYVREVVKVQIK